MQEEAKKELSKLDPTDDYEALYGQLRQQSQGVQVPMTKSLAHQQYLENKLKTDMYPPAAVSQYVERAPEKLQTWSGKTVHPQGISVEAVQNNMSRVGNNIRQARAQGDENTVRELTIIRNKLSEDLEAMGGISDLHKRAGAAFRQAQALIEELENS